ncbi:MAG: hypothetical protein RLZZ04_4229 [Cyanobacteriota bacterium]|jgi:hypothetical protein
MITQLTCYDILLNRIKVACCPEMLSAKNGFTTKSIIRSQSNYFE